MHEEQFSARLENAVRRLDERLNERRIDTRAVVERRVEEHEVGRGVGVLRSGIVPRESESGAGLRPVGL